MADPVELPPWEDVASRFQSAFPNLSPDYVRQQYETTRSLRNARERHVNWEPPPVHTVLQAVPFVGTVHNARIDYQFSQAQRRIQSGQGTPDDFDNVAQYERAQDLAGNRTVSEVLGHTGLDVARTAGEAYLGGAALGSAAELPSLGAPLRAIGIGAEAAAPAATLLGRGGQFAGRTAAQTAVMPSMYVPEMTQQNLQAGRDALDLRGLPSAFAVGMIQTALLGTIGHQVNAARPGTGVAATLQRLGAAGPLGVVESSVADLLAGAAHLRTGYGVLGDLAEGRYDDAWQHAATSALAFTAFAGLHETGQRLPIMQEFASRSQELARQGLSREAAGKVLEKEVQAGIDHFQPDHQSAQGPEPGIDRMPQTPAETPQAQPPAEVAPNAQAQAPATPMATPEPVRTSPKVIQDAIDALHTLGGGTEKSRKEAEARVQQTVDASPQPFGTAIELIQKAYEKQPAAPAAPPQPEPAQPAAPVQPPAAPPSLRELFERSQAGEPVAREQINQAAGWTPQEAHVVWERMSGRTQAEIASDPEVNVTSRARVQQIEKAAMAKSGGVSSIKATIYEADRQSRMVRDAENGNRVNATDLRTNPEDVVKKVVAKLSAREEAQKALDKIGTEMMAEADANGGTLTKESRDRYAARIDEANRQAESNQRVEDNTAEGVRPETQGNQAEGNRPAEPQPPVASAPPENAVRPGPETAEGLIPRNTPYTMTMAEWQSKYGHLPREQRPAGDFDLHARTVSPVEEHVPYGSSHEEVTEVIPESEVREHQAMVQELTSAGLYNEHAKAAIERVVAGHATGGDHELLQQFHTRAQEKVTDAKREAEKLGYPAKTVARIAEESLRAGESDPALKADVQDRGPAPGSEANRPGPGSEQGVQPIAAQPDSTMAFGKPLAPSEKAALPGGGQMDAAPEGAKPKGTTALANEITDAQREKEGKSPILRQAAKANPAVWGEAMSRIDADPAMPARLVDELVAKNRPTSREENAVLLWQRVALSNEHARSIHDSINAFKEEAKAKLAGMNPAEAKAKSDAAYAREADLNERMSQLDKVIVDTGSEWGAAGQFRRQLVAEDYSLSSMLRGAEAAAKRPLTPEEKTKIEALSTKIAELQGKLNAAEDKLQAAGTGSGGAEYPVWVKAKIENTNARGEYTGQVGRFRWENMTTAQKTTDWIRRARIAMLISGPVTAGKVGAASVWQVAAPPARELIGSALRMVPGIRQIAEKAPIEGRGFELATELAAVKAAGAQGTADGWQTLRAGKSDLDVLHGQQFDAPRTWLDFFGNLHAAEKAPAVRGAYERAFRQIEASEKEAGRDTTSIAALESIGSRAYAEGVRAKFQQDNALVDAIEKGINTLKKPDQSSASQALGHLADVLLPIRRTPTNIIADALEHIAGLPVGAGRAGVAWAKGIENLRPEQADSIMRMMKKGTLGMSMVALGYYLANNAGGFYSGKRRDDDLKPGEIKVGNLVVPSWATSHHPVFMGLQFGATISRAQTGAKRGDVGVAEGTLHGFGSLLEEVPLIREQREIAEVMRFNESSTGRLARSFVVPQLIQWSAQQMDKQEGRPNPHGTLQQIQVGLPVYRQRLDRKY